MAESIEARYERYQNRIHELQRKSKAVEKKLQEKERKRRSTMLIAYGLLVMEEIKQGVLSEEDVLAKLDGILTQNSHRSAVGLPSLKRKKKTATAPSTLAQKATPEQKRKITATTVAKAAASQPNGERYVGVN